MLSTDFQKNHQKIPILYMLKLHLTFPVFSEMGLMLFMDEPLIEKSLIVAQRGILCLKNKLPKLFFSFWFSLSKEGKFWIAKIEKLTLRYLMKNKLVDETL